MSKSRKVA